MSNPVQQYDELVEMKRGVMERLKKRSWRVYLIVVLVIAFVAAAVGNYAGNWAQHQMEAAFHLLVAVPKSPMWKGSIFVLAWVFCLVTVSFFSARAESKQHGKTLESRVTEAESRATAAEGEKTALRTSVDQLVATLRYGVEDLYDIPALDAIDHAAMLVSLHELTPFLRNVHTTCAAVWQPLKGISSAQPQTSPIGWLRASIEEREGAYPANALGAWIEFLSQKRDPRGILICWHGAYRKWRDEMVRFAACLGRTITEVSGYEEWRAAELALAAELTKKLELPALQVVRVYMHAYDGAHGALSAPPPTVAIAEVGDYGAAVRSLALADDAEERFLELFCASQNPMVATNPSTFLANDVYRAGERLVEKKLLESATVGDHTVRFWLPSVARTAWAGDVRARLVRYTVDIDLRTVRGTGASGGGARGGYS